MYSFFIHSGAEIFGDIKRVAQNLFAHQPHEQVCSAHFEIIAEEVFTNKQFTYFLSGKIDNLHAAGSSIKVKAGIEICALLIEQHGWKTVSKWKGCFAFGCIDAEKNELLFTIGNTGSMQSYVYLHAGAIAITSGLKAFRHSSVMRTMIPLNTYKYEYTKPVEQDFCFIKNMKRVIPGYVYTVKSSKNQSFEITPAELSPLRSIESAIPYEHAKEKLYALLLENISCKRKADRAGVPVSGGVDSGVVASLLHQSGADVYTYSAGTDFGNEFQHARELHNYIHSTHREIFIDEEKFWEGFIQSVWLNEICDPLYAEGYVSFYHVFKNAAADVQQVFTGYGADLVLGDFLNIPDRSQINTVSEYWCRRAGWTGEMSPYVAASFGVEVQHPFWETEIINFGLSLPYTYKYKDEEVKAVLREMAQDKNLLPHNIAWRKKNALTTGTSIDQLFSRCLGINHVKNYELKSIFLYYLFEALFVNDIEPADVNIPELIQKSKSYAP